MNSEQNNNCGPRRLLFGPQRRDAGSLPAAGDQPFCVLPANATISDLEDAIANHLTKNEPLDIYDETDSSGSYSSSPPPPTLSLPGSPAMLDLTQSSPSMPVISPAASPPPLDLEHSRLSADSTSQDFPHTPSSAFSRSSFSSTVGSPQAPLTPFPLSSPFSSPPSSPDASFSSPLHDSDDSSNLFQLSPDTSNDARDADPAVDLQARFPDYALPVDISRDEFGFGWMSYNDSSQLFPLENPFQPPRVRRIWRRNNSQQPELDEQISEE